MFHIAAQPVAALHAGVCVYANRLIIKPQTAPQLPDENTQEIYPSPSLSFCYKYNGEDNVWTFDIALRI